MLSNFEFEIMSKFLLQCCRNRQKNFNHLYSLYNQLRKFSLGSRLPGIYKLYFQHIECYLKLLGGPILQSGAGLALAVAV